MAKKIELRVYQCRWCNELWKNDSGIPFHVKKAHPEHVDDTAPLIIRKLSVEAMGGSLSIDISTTKC